MLKKICICLLAASATLVSGAPKKKVAAATGATTATNTAPAPAAAAPAPAVQAHISTPPRFTEAELAAAQPAKVYTNCVNPGQFVLTFDDGPSLATTPIALNFLREKQIPATFFVNALNYGNLESDPAAIELVKQIFNEGHDIASHTYYHQDLYSAIAEGTMESNIDMMTDKIAEIIGYKPAFFRPPNGLGVLPAKNAEEQAMNDRIQKYLGASGYKIIMWGADTRDWEYKANTQMVQTELDKDLKKPGFSVSPATSSFITLMHDVHADTVNTVLPFVYNYVTSLGYQFVSLPECLGLQSAYQMSPTDGLSSNLVANQDAQNQEVPETGDSSDATTVGVKMVLSTLAVILSLFFLY